MPTFDIVSKYDIQEVENSVNMVTRDITNRYDFRGSDTTMIFEGVIPLSLLIKKTAPLKLNPIQICASALCGICWKNGQLEDPLH